MLGTVMLESYLKDDAREVWAALRDLCPRKGWAWAPAGIYCYWQPKSREVLYLGLASDLAQRFAQHNGLIAHRRGNKSAQIAAYFEQNDRLGFSVVVQSAAVMAVDRNAIDSAHDTIRTGEGQLLEAYRSSYGRYPTWNAMGGAVTGQAKVTPLTRNYFRLMTGEIDSLLVARRSLRHLSAEPTADFYEQAIHTARMYALEKGHRRGGTSDLDILRWLERLEREAWRGADPAILQSLRDSGYLNQRPDV
jgi:hypothetical protein